MFADGYMPKRRTWTQLKDDLAKRGGSVQYEESIPIGGYERYLIYFYDGPEVLFTEIWKGEVHPSAIDAYPQQQNDSDKAEFESAYKPNANSAIEPKAKDGRMTVRTSATNRMQNFKLRCFSWYSARTTGVHNVNPVTDQDYGDLVVSLWKLVNGVWTATTEGDNDATKTVLDWEPHYDYEIIGGNLDIPSSLRDGVTDQWYISCVGVPDYPPPPLAFGSIDYISEVNIESITTQKVVSDGRAVSYLPYQYGGYPGTNKLRFVLKHPPGEKKRFQAYIEHFAAW